MYLQLYSVDWCRETDGRRDKGINGLSKEREGGGVRRIGATWI